MFFMWWYQADDTGKDTDNTKTPSDNTLDNTR